jgi:hypothetical protein
LIWERIANGDTAAVRARWMLYAGIWTILLGLWYSARRFKKARRAPAA